MFDTLSQLAAEWILPVLFFWLVMCLFAINIQEWIATRLAARARTLEFSIRNMLGNIELTHEFYDHPLVKSVVFRAPTTKSQIPWLEKILESDPKKQRPDNINSRLFAQVILDWIMTQDTKASANRKPANLSQLHQNVRAMRLKYPQLSEVLEVLLQGIVETKANPGEVFSSFQTNLERWFDNAMEEASLHYKRRVQATLLSIGLILAIYSNFDPISMTIQLWDSSHSEQAASTNGENNNPAKLPIGWEISNGITQDATCKLFPGQGQYFGIPLSNGRCLNPLSPTDQTNIFVKLAGFFVGSLLISIGSQYVFDLWKNKIKT